MAKARKMIDGHRDTIDKIDKARRDIAPDGFDVWIHAASLGEFEQARPLIEKIKRETPSTTILLTFFSPSGYEVRKNYPQADAVAYLPFDTPRNARRFLDAARPKKAIFVKYEFWGNYLQQLRRRKIPTYIISAIFRTSQIFFRPYGRFMRKLLKCYTKLFVQDENSKALLAKIGITKVEVTGDTRFDRVTDVMRSNVDFPIVTEWKNRSDDPLIVVGSSWQPDEACYIPYLNSRPEIRAIIAPHEFDAERLSELQSKLNGKSQLFSDAEKKGCVDSGVKYLIVDSFGKLSSLYRYGDAAIIGGGFGAGIHNINEAAVYSIPVIFGPNHHKFKEASDLMRCGGGFEYTDKQSLAEILNKLFDSSDHAKLQEAGKAAGEYIKRNLGATDKVYAQIFNNKTKAK